MHPTAESKSLDSHLYRIRKKLFSISKNITIFSVNKNTLKIKFSTATKDLLD